MSDEHSGASHQVAEPQKAVTPGVTRSKPIISMVWIGRGLILLIALGIWANTSNTKTETENDLRTKLRTLYQTETFLVEKGVPYTVQINPQDMYLLVTSSSCSITDDRGAVNFFDGKHFSQKNQPNPQTTTFTFENKKELMNVAIQLTTGHAGILYDASQYPKVQKPEETKTSFSWSWSHINTLLILIVIMLLVRLLLWSIEYFSEKPLLYNVVKGVVFLFGFLGMLHGLYAIILITWWSHLWFEILSALGFMFYWTEVVIQSGATIPQLTSTLLKSTVHEKFVTEEQEVAGVIKDVPIKVHAGTKNLFLHWFYKLTANPQGDDEATLDLQRFETSLSTKPMMTSEDGAEVSVNIKWLSVLQEGREDEMALFEGGVKKAKEITKEDGEMVLRGVIGAHLPLEIDRERKTISDEFTIALNKHLEERGVKIPYINSDATILDVELPGNYKEGLLKTKLAEFQMAADQKEVDEMMEQIKAIYNSASRSGHPISWEKATEHWLLKFGKMSKNVIDGNGVPIINVGGK